MPAASGINARTAPPVSDGLGHLPSLRRTQVAVAHRPPIFMRRYETTLPGEVETTDSAVFLSTWLARRRVVANRGAVEAHAPDGTRCSLAGTTCPGSAREYRREPPGLGSGSRQRSTHSRIARPTRRLTEECRW